jgi:hypothetical protein
MIFTEARVGMRMRMSEHDRIAERRGVVGRVVGRYGGEEHMALDILLSDGKRRLFWPAGLAEISSSRPSGWHALLGRGGVA